MDYLNNVWKKNRILKFKNSLLEQEKDFKQLKDRELGDMEIKIRKEIEENTNRTLHTIG